MEKVQSWSLLTSEGNFGEVYLGEYSISRKKTVEVALKKLHDEAAVVEFEKEADALGFDLCTL